MGRLGVTEFGLILALVIVLIVFGAGKLPSVFRDLGRGVKEFREAASEKEKEKDEKNEEKK